MGENRVIDLQRHGDVFVLKLDRDENRFRPDFLDAIASALDEVEAAGNPAALVTTGAGRFYSNGLDLDWMHAQDRDDAAAYLQQLGAAGQQLGGGGGDPGPPQARPPSS